MIGPHRVHRGIDAITSELESQKAMGFRNIRVDVTSLVVDGGAVMMERVDHFTVEGNPFSMEVMAALEVDADGRIKRWRDCYDMKSITGHLEAARFRAPA